MINLITANLLLSNLIIIIAHVILKLPHYLEEAYVLCYYVPNNITGFNF